MKKAILIIFLLNVFSQTLSAQGWGDYSEIFFGKSFDLWWTSVPSFAQVPNSDDIVISYGGSILRRGTKNWDKQHVPPEIHPYEGQTHFIETNPDGIFVSWDYLIPVDTIPWTWDRVHVFAEFDYDGNLISQNEFLMEAAGDGTIRSTAYSYAAYLLNKGNLISIEYEGNDRIRYFDKLGNLIWDVQSPIDLNDEKPSVIQLADGTIVLVSKYKWIALINPDNGNLKDKKEFSNELNKDVLLAEDQESFYLLKEGEIKYCDVAGNTITTINYPSMELAKNKAWVELGDGIVAILGHSGSGFILKKVDLKNEQILFDTTYSDFGDSWGFHTDLIFKSSGSDLMFFGMSTEQDRVSTTLTKMRGFQLDAISGELKRSWENGDGGFNPSSWYRSGQEFVGAFQIGDLCYVATQFSSNVAANGEEEPLSSQLVKFGTGERIGGFLFEDSIENCSMDSGEEAIEDITIKFKTKSGTEHIRTTNWKGFYFCKELKRLIILLLKQNMID